MNKILSTFIISLTLFFILSTRTIFAANSIIGTVPQSGSYGAPFSVAITIDGHGDIFNAAQAKVTVSEKLTVTDLTLGDCNLSFLKTPSINDLSFKGGILKGSSKKCTVYTLMLSPNDKGSASVLLSDASVRHFGDGKETLASVQKGTYTLTGKASINAHVQDKAIPTPAVGLYTVNVGVRTQDNGDPVSDVSVSIASASGGSLKTLPTDSSGKALFQNIKPAIYAISVQRKNKIIAKTILSVNGQNHILSFNINLKAQQNNPLMKQKTGLDLNNPILIGGLLGFLGILSGLAVAVVPRLLKRKKEKL